MQHLAIKEVNTKDEDRTVVYFAAETGHYLLVEYLIWKKADLKIIVFWGSVLHAASATGNVAINNLLFDKGIKIEEEWTEKGSMASVTSVPEDQVAAIEVLLNRGVQIEAKTNVGDTGLIYAAGRG
jgi:hypothetical protein